MDYKYGQIKRTRFDLSALKASINGQADNIKKLRAKKRNCIGAGEKQKYSLAIKAAGDIIRYHLLAYAFLRGKNRSSLERPSNKNKLVYLDGYFTFKNKYMKGTCEQIFSKRIYEICSLYTSNFLWVFKIDEDDIGEWLIFGEINRIFVKNGHDLRKNIHVDDL